MQALSVTTTENWSVCLGYYRRRGDAPYKKRYAYVPNGSQTALLASYQNGSDTAYTYTYDENGNIISISQGGSTTYYTYDRLNELIREDNATLNQSWTYTYDTNGNLLNKKRYAYVPNGGTLGACLETISYGYDAAHQDWADQLTSYNGETIRYDDSGNPISYRGYTMAWQGKRLTSANKSGTTITYSYDENGIRTQKTVNGVSTNYYYNGSVLISQVSGNDTLLFSYDASGSVVSVNFNGTDYYYVRNGQGDVVKLIDGSGNTVTEYTYDTWGKLLSCTGSLSATLGTLNPFRYRGYVYDNETGFYYLQSRYYDPAVCRFISADVLLSTGQGVLGHNTFAYCLNNPVNMSDLTGCAPSLNDDNDGNGIPDYLEHRWATLTAEYNLILYTKQNSKYEEDYISINFQGWEDILDSAISTLGIEQATSIISHTACQEYANVIGKEFPLSDNTVAYEIEYHIDGYLYAQGYDYFFERNITTWLFPKSVLNKHCCTAEIYAKDIEDGITEAGFYESIFFGYRSGKRE